jgi:nucleoid-associated protein YgaU
MITSRSRYVDGRIVPQPDGEVSVHRNFPNPPGNQFLYTWAQSDRLDRLAGRYLGSPLLWWKIMDANPMVQNPADIRPGQQIRIPGRV